MADILAFNLTQTDSHAPRVMNAPDLSTKLKWVIYSAFLFLGLLPGSQAHGC
jgi:hypothetical protein